MKKQALLLVALAFSMNASAAYSLPSMSLPTLPTINFQALTTLNNHRTIAASLFLAATALVIYKFYANGGYTNNPVLKEAKKEGESDFFKYGTSFPTAEQKHSKELPLAKTPVVTPAPVATTVAPEAQVSAPVVTAPVAAPAQEATPIVEKSTLATLAERVMESLNEPTYFDNIVKQQMEVLE